MPFAYGHAFRQGDVPAGLVVLGNTADFQCSPLTYWPDGSLKHAVIAGRTNATAGGTVSITLSKGSAPSAQALTEADLAAAAADVRIQVGSFTAVLANLVGTSALHTTVCVGPVMSNWIYRQSVTSSAHLVVWLDVRLYRGGTVEVFPWVENGYFTVPNPTNAVVACSVIVAGQTRFSQTIDIKHRTRVPLLTGSTFSYWTPADPGFLPQHDGAYLIATKLVPNFGYSTGIPSSSLSALQQSYMPNDLAGVDSHMGAAGGRGSPLSKAGALYLKTNGDGRAFRAMMVFGLSSGSWSIHYRDQQTNHPIRFSDYPNVSISSGGSPDVPNGAGGQNGTDSVTHLPSFPYAPFLITARWWFLEELLFWTTQNYIYFSRFVKRGADHIIDGQADYVNRGAAWGLLTLAQALGCCPSSHPLFSNLKRAWENNCRFYRAKYVDGTTYTSVANGTESFGSTWISPQGYLGESTLQSLEAAPNAQNKLWIKSWMSAYNVMVWGLTSDMGLPISAQAQSDHIAVRNQAYKQPVARADDGLSGRYNWRRFIVYSYPVGGDVGGQIPPSRWLAATESASVYEVGFSLGSIPSTTGLSLKEHSSNNDLYGSSSSIDFGLDELPSLALAVDHGIPGALAGWNRITSASNFGILASAGTDYRPEYGIVPR